MNKLRKRSEKKVLASKLEEITITKREYDELKHMEKMVRDFHQCRRRLHDDKLQGKVLPVNPTDREDLVKRQRNELFDVGAKTPMTIFDEDNPYGGMLC